MFNDDHNRERYAADQEYFARENYVRYGYDARYEADRNRTSESYRDSLQTSLEKPASRSRLERADDVRYECYRAASPQENNYDKFFDGKHRKPEKKTSKRRTALLVAYVAIALVAIIAVTLAVVGISDNKVVEEKPLTIESLSASAEGIAPVSGLAAAESEEEKTVVGGENYILLKTGELVEVEVPEKTTVQPEKEKGFDKFCSWLNGIFGG